MYEYISLVAIGFVLYQAYRYIKQPNININYSKGDNNAVEHYKGWYSLGRTDELKVGEIKETTVFDQELIYYRGKSGKVYAVESKCLHLGANLGQGTVIDDNIQCPFHGWKYAGDGFLCKKSPLIEYDPLIDESFTKECKLKSYDICEVDEMILLWFGPGTPEWEPPTILLNNQFEYRGTSTVNVKASIVDIVNNGVDTLHFKYVHDKLLPLNNYFKIDWKLNWFLKKDFELELIEPELRYTIPYFDQINENNIFVLVLRNTYNIFKFQNHMNVLAYQVGPSLTYLFFNSNLASGLYIQQVIPHKNYSTIRTDIYTSKNTWVICSFFLLLGDLFQLLNDAKIWSNKASSSIFKKIHLKKTKIDLNNITWWQWFKQFYFKPPSLDW